MTKHTTTFQQQMFGPEFSLSLEFRNIKKIYFESFQEIGEFKREEDRLTPATSTNRHSARVWFGRRNVQSSDGKIIYRAILYLCELFRMIWTHGMIGICIRCFIRSGQYEYMIRLKTVF